MSSSPDKVIIVTGASRGMGKSMAEILLRSSDSCKIVLVARSGDRLQEFVDSLTEKEKARVHFVAGDLTDAKTLDQLVDESVAKFGKINSVIFNAGILEPIAHIEKIDISQMKKLFDVNFFSLVELTQRLLPVLRETAKQDGVPATCVYVSSSASEVRYDGWLAYGSSKAAVNHLAMDLDAEESLVRAISIDPGVVDTGMQVNIRENLGKGMKADAHKKFIEFHEKGQLLKPEVPGGVCALLALKGVPNDLGGKYLEHCDESLSSFQFFGKDTA
ncbi:hypothetical protein PMKS-003169 [Pichia membranifaciens]|uniref:Ketoreductase domain-containing protein n=1 Tax=Pichia membranifaciens TaxID=4926 RepID=A0A1Q2YJE5_9ASCO|nr:hypothetical protein PMKS-003169 [Pichia membranifaciens]